MKKSVSHRLPPGVQPYLFAYDIRCPKRGKRVLRILRRWRVDVQYSVHETLLLPAQVRDLSVELLDEVEQEQDRLLVTRLSHRGDGPVYQWHPRRKRKEYLFGGHGARPMPDYLHSGCYLLAYDVCCPRRLQRLQRLVAKKTAFLQRSVYFFQGKGAELRGLVADSSTVLERGDDDLRLYAVASPRDLWFLSGDTPPLGGLESRRTRGLWKRLSSWLFNEGKR